MDQDVHELEKGARLQEIYNRMDPRAQAVGKGPFGRRLLRRKRSFTMAACSGRLRLGASKVSGQLGRPGKSPWPEGPLAHRTSFNVALVRPRVGGKYVSSVVTKVRILDLISWAIQGLRCQSLFIPLVLAYLKATDFDEKNREIPGLED